MTAPSPIRQQEHAKFWRDSALDNLELLRATYITHIFPPHAHEEFAIGVIESGAQAFIYRGRAHMVMPAGCIAVVNPGELHVGHAANRGGWTYRMLYPDSAILRRIASEMAGHARDIPFFPNPIIDDDDLFRIIQRMHQVIENPHTTPLARETYLTWGLTHLINRYADSRLTLRPCPPEKSLAQRVKHYLETHYQEKVLLDDLANVAGVSRFYLLRAFKQEVGIPPHAYLLQFRVQQARRLLSVGMPIADVAAETGFTDQSHFSKFFKRVIGVSPGQFLGHI